MRRHPRRAGEDAHGLIDNWLRHVQDVARAHDVKLNAIEDSTRASIGCVS